MTRQLYSTILLIILLGIYSGCNNKKEADREFVISKIERAAKLATTEFVVTKMVLAQEKSGKVVKWFGGKDAVFVAHTEATIKAGIDLDKLRPQDIEIEETSISVTLPSIEIINFSYPAEKFVIDTVNSRTKTVFSKISMTEIDALYRQAELDIENQFEKLGIRESAKAKTVTLVRRLISYMGFTDINIRFADDDDTPLDTPSIPESAKADPEEESGRKSKRK